ncbi:MAG TPA: M56 family metallopeptidase [Gemmatimonadaceae bacterium]|nr:M56 family metallopeptidase [Gemmatimonadaceae bacterium]
MELEQLGTLALSWVLRGSVILAIALLASRLLARRSAALRHAVLAAGMIAALVAPPFSGLGLMALIPADVATWFSDPVPSAAMPNATPTFRAPVIDLLPSGSSLPAPDSTWPSLWSLAVLAWLLGAALVLARTALAAMAAAQLRRQSRPVIEARIRDLVKRDIDLRASERIAAPATLGILRPVVLLPADAATWETGRLRAILAHEVAHVERQDCLTTLLAEVVAAMYWPNPLVWIARRQLVLERERACDDVALLAGAEPTQYGMLLLDVARAAYARPPLPAAVISMARPKELESRLVSIVRGDGVERSALSRRSRALVISLTALLGTAAASHVQSQPPSPRAPEPDRRGDSLSAPSSERVPVTANVAELEARVRGSALWSGPDSLLVRELVSHLPHAPTSPEDLVRDRTIWALSQARGDKLVEPLLQALGDDDWRVRAYAAWTLGMAREPRAVPALIAALEHPVWRLRAMAASALDAIGDPRAIDAMSRALNDEAWQVRMPAVSFVASHAQGKTAAGLLQPLRTDRHIAVRLAVQKALR